MANEKSPRYIGHPSMPTISPDRQSGCQKISARHGKLHPCLSKPLMIPSPLTRGNSVVHGGGHFRVSSRIDDATCIRVGSTSVLGRNQSPAGRLTNPRQRNVRKGVYHAQTTQLQGKNRAHELLPQFLPYGHHPRLKAEERLRERHRAGGNGESQVERRAEQREVRNGVIVLPNATGQSCQECFPLPRLLNPPTGTLDGQRTHRANTSGKLQNHFCFIAMTTLT